MHNVCPSKLVFLSFVLCPGLKSGAKDKCGNNVIQFRNCVRLYPAKGNIFVFLGGRKFPPYLFF